MRNGKKLSREYIRKLADAVRVHQTELEQALADRYEEIKKKTESANFCRFLGIKCIELNQGFAHLELPAHKHLANWNKVAHGGATGTLIDQAIGSALATLINYDEELITSFNVNTNYLRKAELGRNKVLCVKTFWSDPGAMGMMTKNGSPAFLDVPMDGRRLINIHATVIQKPERIIVAEGNAWFLIKGTRGDARKTGKKRKSAGTK